MTVIATSTTSTATGTGPGRRLDRCQDGTLWSFTNANATSLVPSYSKDGGATWTAATAQSGVTNCSVFIDLDDYCHVVWKQNGTTGPNGAALTAGYIYYMRGTPNAGRTAWTWSSAVAVNSTPYMDVPDVVAFRTPGSSPTTWEVGIVASYNSGTNPYTAYVRLSISNTGTVTNSREGLTAFSASLFGYLGGAYGSYSGHTYPSIDFHHTGDGKTVQGGTPHVYAGWSVPSSGAGLGIRFRKVVYSAGAWTCNAEREIDPNRSLAGLAAPYSAWLCCIFDGTRVVLPLYAYNNATGQLDLTLWDRDAADTATILNGPYLAAGAPTTTALDSGSASYDNAGNVYVFGADASGANGTRNINWRKWTRATGTLGAITTVDATGPDAPYISARRGYGGNAIDIVYTDKTATYDVTFLRAVTLNVAPNAPTLTGPANNSTIDRNIVQRFSWTFNDPDAGDTQSQFDLQYRVGTGAWTTVTGTTPNQFYDFAAGALAAGTYEWQVRTYDSQGVVGPWSTSNFVTMANPPAAPVITAPTSGSVVSTGSTNVTWSAPSQSAYEVRTVADNAGSPDTSTIYTDSGVVVDTSARVRTTTFSTNNRYEHVQVRVQVAGLWSTWSSVRVQISFTTPANPSAFTIVPGDDTITANVTNPAPTGTQPAVTRIELWRRAITDVDGNLVLGPEGYAVRVANVSPSGGGVTSITDYTVASGVNYEYQAVMQGSNSTWSYSDWVS